MGARLSAHETNRITFLVGDEAFIHHAGGLVTLKVPLIAIGHIRIAFISFTEAGGESAQLRPAVENPPISGEIPIVPMSALVFMKLKAGRQKDLADLVELLKHGKIETDEINQCLAANAHDQVARWEHFKRVAATEE